MMDNKIIEAYAMLGPRECRVVDDLVLSFAEQIKRLNNLADYTVRLDQALKDADSRAKVFEKALDALSASVRNSSEGDPWEDEV